MDNVDKYSVSQYSVKSLLGYIDAGDIAISEIQRLIPHHIPLK